VINLIEERGFDMDLVLFEDSIEYDVWIKAALVFPIILLIALGILFYIDAHYCRTGLR